MVEHAAVNRRVVGSSPTRGANCFQAETDALLVNAIPALKKEWGFCICAGIKGICGFGDLAVFSVLKRVTKGVRF